MLTPLRCYWNKKFFLLCLKHNITKTYPKKKTLKKVSLCYPSPNFNIQNHSPFDQLLRCYQINQNLIIQETITNHKEYQQKMIIYVAQTFILTSSPESMFHLRRSTRWFRSTTGSSAAWPVHSQMLRPSSRPQSFTCPSTGMTFRCLHRKIMYNTHRSMFY